ncbi:hypothetical protein POP12_025 [Pectobacterium phage POP12]|nr:hypothetical protein POP12_025 [Pectobacterium phage POP12]
MSDIKEIHSALMFIKAGYRNNSVGICDNLRAKVNNEVFAMRFLHLAFKDFGLCTLYPVESHMSGINPILGMTNFYTLHKNLSNQYDIQKNKFNKRSEYGKFRLELLDRLIQRAENQL